MRTASLEHQAAFIEQLKAKRGVLLGGTPFLLVIVSYVRFLGGRSPFHSPASSQHHFFTFSFVEE